ncbi:MAG: hypothetical protein OXD49_04725 [Candidatus Poribacteria bacterium]|nr:hypothetical protein [Candidatus Poribacteria bacterium]
MAFSSQQSAVNKRLEWKNSVGKVEDWEALVLPFFQPSSDSR